MSVTLPIERRPLGRADLTIPRVALGCGNFGGVGSAPELFGQGLSEDEAFALMDAAWELGIDHFDTADAYGAGRIRAYGVSNFDAAQLEAALAAGAPQAIQNEHSLLARGDEAGVLPLCEREQVAYAVFSPLAGGWLTGKYRRGEPFPAGSRMTQRPDPYRTLVTGRTFDTLDALRVIAADH